jgi:glycine/serine hydroxymethyltransferase
MGRDEMTRIGGWIARILEQPEDAAVAREVEHQVLELTAGFPLFAQAAPR